MLDRLKMWFGIEGVKLELELPESVNGEDGVVHGQIIFRTLHPQVVTRVQLAFIERYGRGRGKDRLVDEYELGNATIHTQLEIPAQEEVRLPFMLTFKLVKSAMDEWESRNLLTAGAARAAKWFSRVQSEYRVEAEAIVKGTALNPFDKKPIKIH